MIHHSSKNDEKWNFEAFIIFQYNFSALILSTYSWIWSTVSTQKQPY